VPGKLPANEQAQFEQKVGYQDSLAIMSEPYRLWAIETSSEKTASILSFAAADARVILAPSINKYKEIKLRLLNATHSLCCGVAILSDFLTVRDALNDGNFKSFLSTMLLDEIVPLVAEGDITMEEARSFAMQVIDRFSNQSIEHLWVNIAVQYTAKMQMRVVPLVDKYVKQHGKVPMLISFGFAAYLLFMKSKNDPGAIDALASKTTIVASEVFDKQVFDCIDKMDASSIKNVLVSLLNK
jgi:tagaturonate reductase